jgi:hypothetical protein
MAFDWLGTFNKSQFDRFAAFAEAQLGVLAGRILHLQYEILRVGRLSFSYDANGTPKAYDTGGPNTYIGKLIAAYEVLGGNALYDLNVRDMAQAVYLLPAGEMSPPQLMSNGEVMGQPGLADGPSAMLIQQARSWLPEAMDYRRERIERQIRRMVDYVDQLEAEMDLLDKMAASTTTKGSLQNIFAAINDLFHDPIYRTIYDDRGKDPHGKLTYAPFKPYSDDGKSEDREPSLIYGRDDGGATVPGEGSSV